MTRNHVTYIKGSTGTNNHQQLLNFNHIILYWFQHWYHLKNSFWAFLWPPQVLWWLSCQTIPSQCLSCSQLYYLWEGWNSSCPKWPIMLCAWSMIISINHFPLWIALGDTHITSHDRLFFMKINPSFIPNFACAFGFSNILEYIFSC